MKLPLYWIDAFSSRPFHGNPAGVVPLETWLPDEVMQRIAFENGLSETAFFVPTGPGRYHLRWFTPAVEVELCGHATLASACVLFTQLGFAGGAITFDSRSGPLSVAHRDGLFELDFPSRPAESAPAPETLVRALGRTPETVRKTKGSWLLVYPRADDVLGLRPDHTLLREVTPGRMIVTAPGQDCDFVSRFFAPDAGIAEDPVTGGAHTTLIPYWAGRLGKTKLHARQVSARGGELFCAFCPSANPGAGGDRVKIAGHAVLYLRGEIQV